MDRRHIELQIRTVLVTYHAERRRRDSSTMNVFREQARLLLDDLDESVRPYPDLQARLEQARLELEADLA